MKIEPEDIMSFQRLWKEQFQTDLSETEGQEKANCLLELMKAIYKPIPKPQKLVENKQLTILDFNENSHEI
ncbi:hypothetical protein KKG19_05430 [Patescibacteria group bacterium]|nr:hypothetical protein [Patescibacteria group bacterium]